MRRGEFVYQQNIGEPWEVASMHDSLAARGGAELVVLLITTSKVPPSRTALVTPLFQSVVVDDCGRSKRDGGGYDRRSIMNS
jgi:hypothetical protein